MLKLFKYNWKKSEVMFYSVLGIVAILYIPLLILGRRDIWWDEFVVFAAIGLMSICLQVLIIVVIYNFNASLKSITRRLLPISRATEYIAFMLVPILYNMAFSALLWVFMLLLKPQFQVEGLNNFIDSINIVEVTVSLFVFTLFYSIFSISMLYFAVAFARMFKTNLRILIFLAVSFILSVIYGVGLELMQSDPLLIQQGTIRVEYNVNETVTINWFSLSWIQLVELAFAFVLSYFTVYIMKRKIEV